jgi:hypothetical protein
MNRLQLSMQSCVSFWGGGLGRAKGYFPSDKTWTHPHTDTISDHRRASTSFGGLMGFVQGCVSPGG